MAKKWKSLGTKLIITAGASVFVAMSAMVGIMANDTYKATLETYTDYIQSETNNFADGIKNTVDSGYAMPNGLKSTFHGMQASNTVSRESMTSIIKASLEENAMAIGAWAVFEPNMFDGKDDNYRLDWPKHDPSGRYTPYVTKGADGKAVVDTMMSGDRIKAFPEWKDKLTAYVPDYEKSGWGDFYFVPKSRGKDTITEPFYYDVQGKKVLESSMVTVLKSPTGQFVGVFSADVALDTLQNKFGKKQINGSGYATLISEGGLYVVNPDASKLGKEIDKDDKVKKFLTNRESKPFHFEDGDNTRFYVPIVIGNTDQIWYANITVPTSVITQSAVTARNKAILVGVLSLIGILVLLTVVVSKMIRPLKVLADSMEELAQGQGDLTVRLKVVNNDEIGKTASAFNQFIESLQKMFISVRDQSESVIQATKSITQSAEEVERSSAAQSDASSATAAGVEEVTVSVHHIADTATDAARIAVESGIKTDNSVETVVRVTEEINRMTETMHAISTRINGVGERSEEVSSIVSVIKDIADQTNLLALNAAIEAARAGEQGRGFAVVADEVRKLAARTAEATVQITRIVEAMGKETQQAVQEVRLSNEAVAVSVKTAQDANNAMMEVKAHSEALVQNINEIASSTREQSVAASEIAQNVEHISLMAQNNAQTVNQVRDAVQRLNQLAQQLEDQVKTFKLE